MTTGKISYYDGNVYFEADGNPYAIDIIYKGKINAESMLPNGFLIQEKNNRILILRMSHAQMPELLFTYTGEFRIRKADLYTENSRINASLDTNLHYPNRLSDNWVQLNSTWGEYSDEYAYGDPLNKKRTDIVTNNIESTSGALVLKDGTPYLGGVHFHSEGYFMTGSHHTKDSVRLYHKNKKRIVKRKVIRAKQINGGKNG